MKWVPWYCDTSWNNCLTLGQITGRTDAEAETPIFWLTGLLEKTLMLGKIEGGWEGDNRGWDGWMTSPTQWTWVWVNSGSWWWTGKPGMLQSMGSQRVGHDWTELRTSPLGVWIQDISIFYYFCCFMPKQKQHLVVDVTGDWNKDWCCMNNNA